MRFLFFCFSFLVCQLSFSQLLYTEMGQTISNFSYKNSVGGTLDNLQSGTSTYIGAGYFFDLPGDKATILLGGLYTNYKALGSDTTLDNYFEWDVSYVGINTGLSYEFARSREFVFFAKITASLEYLLRGNQVLNNQVFNLSGEDEFDNFILVPRASIGVQYPISNKAALYIQYQYGKSFSLTNSNPTDSETLSINTHNFGIGILINLPGCNCSFKN